MRIFLKIESLGGILLSEKDNLFNALLDSVKSLKSLYTQAITLAYISDQLFRLKDARSEEFFNKALTIAEQMPNNLEQLGLLQHLIGMLVNAVKVTNNKEKLETAINIAKSIYLPYNRFYNLVDILKIFFHFLGKDETLELIKEILPAIDEITSKSYRFELLSEIVTVLCDMGVAFNDLELIQQAKQHLEQIEVSSFYYIALISIAKAFLSYAETNQDLTWISNARELLMKLPEMSSLTTALIDVSFAFLRMEKEKQAEEVIEDAITYAEKIEESSRRSVALSYIAKALIKLNEHDKAKQHLLSAVEAALTLTDQNLLNMAWQSIIEAINDLNSGDKLSLIQEIVETVENHSNVTLRAFAINHVINALMVRDDIEKSVFQEILHKAVETIKLIKNKLVRETAALNLAALLIERSSEIADEFLLKAIFELAEQIRETRNSAYLFTDIARVVLSFGRKKEAEELLDGAMITISLIPNAFTRALVLVYVARRCSELGLQKKFNDLVEELVGVVNEIESPNDLVKTKTGIAELLIQGNEKGRAIQFLHQALENSNELPNELEKADAISSIAKVVLSL